MGARAVCGLALLLGAQLARSGRGSRLLRGSGRVPQCHGPFTAVSSSDGAGVLCAVCEHLLTVGWPVWFHLLVDHLEFCPVLALRS